MKEYNGVLRIYEGDPANDDVIHEVGFTFKDIKDVTQFCSRAVQTLRSYGANPNEEKA